MKIEIPDFLRSRRTVAAGLLAPLALMTTGCSSEPQIKTGTVIEREFSPAHSYLYMQPIPHQICTEEEEPEGSEEISEEECTTSYTYIPITEYTSDEWDIVIKNCAVKTKKGACAERTLDVSQATYDGLRIGEQYTVPSK